MHLLMGVRAEQSLRDAVRDAIERATDDREELVLAPSGRKDWIAGIRVGEAASFREISALGKAVLARLLSLDSRQRIRSENVRLWVVPPPVPVFRDPLPGDAMGDGAAADADGEADLGEEADLGGGEIGWTGGEGF